MPRALPPAAPSPSGLPGALRCRRKFLRQFPGGFRDATYLDWERDYKWDTHLRWGEALPRETFRNLLRDGEFAEAATRAVRVEQRSRHAMLFSFEKMALRDAIRSPEGARDFAQGLYDYLHGRGGLERRFERWVAAIEGLPRRQTRVLTWPLVTVFGFIAQPEQHMFMKPNTIRAAAKKYGYDLPYQSRPTWETYSSLLAFSEHVGRDLADLQPRDMIDLQSFLWVQGSDEY
ncbi:MAG: hypothetical protein M3Q96_06390 [Pseudomonadota bacterium]|nr:hypothetical protein [Pseudomonadota bacterium]MDQ3228346.1 hypothetical protein [Pseudomonadota bacterium]